MGEPETAITNSKCLDCPNIKHAMGLHRAIERSNADMTQTYLSISPEDEAAAAEQALSNPLTRAVLAGAGINSVENFGARLADDVQATFDVADQTLEQVTENVAALTANCQGPLKMRAEKAGRVLTVTACNSPEIPSGDDCDIVHINRQNTD